MLDLFWSLTRHKAGGQYFPLFPGIRCPTKFPLRVCLRTKPSPSTYFDFLGIWSVPLDVGRPNQLFSRFLELICTSSRLNRSSWALQRSWNGSKPTRLDAWAVGRSIWRWLSTSAIHRLLLVVLQMVGTCCVPSHVGHCAPHICRHVRNSYVLSQWSPIIGHCHHDCGIPCRPFALEHQPLAY